MRRLFDFVFACCFLLCLSPLLLVVGVLVRCKLGSPVLFRQTRTGKDGCEFEMIKFRSMTDCRDENGNFLPDHERLTAFGRMLRASSLDELPGFWNILVGDMSVIGPRPQDTKFIARCSAFQNRRHEVRPGITGWAQVNGRNAISWEKRFELDVWYVDNQSLWLDLKIIALTAVVVLSRKNVSADDHATMPEFKPDLHCEPAE